MEVFPYQQVSESTVHVIFVLKPEDQVDLHWVKPFQVSEGSCGKLQDRGTVANERSCFDVDREVSA